MQNKTIEIDTAEDDEVMDKDIVKTTTTTKYADGKPIITIINYKYKED